MRWLARGEIELPADHGWLSDREREQVATIRFTKRRQEYLTRRWTAKHAIAEALALDGDGATSAVLATIEVRNHPSGAPWVAVDGAPAGVELSLTDRAGWAVCLVGRPDADERLGIDLELVEPRSPAFVTDYLTRAEQAHVAAQPDDDARHVAANALWSAKEAALKVLQVGLRADTRTVEVTLHPPARRDGWAELSITGRDGDRFHGWWRRDGEFVLTLATRTPFEPPARSGASADLATASPSHTWLHAPLADDR